MIRVVFDTNIVISGRLWSGAPKQALHLADTGRVKMFISEEMIDELRDVISRPKFANRLNLLSKTAEQVVIDHLQTAEIIEVNLVPSVVKADPDDNKIVACAVAADARYLVSGDPHLLSLKNYENTFIVTVNQFLAQSTVKDLE